jgi:predicted Zn-dependent peptidase
MYKNHPVKIDIAGTIESISYINKDLLYTCYETFYHPSNMLLFIVGPVDAEKVMKQVRDNQQKKDYKEISDIQRHFDEEPETVDQEKQVLKMPVQSSKCMVGLKAKNPQRSGGEMLKYELAMNIILDYAFGKSSSYYEELYADGLIDETFAYDYTEERGFGFALIGGDTDQPEQLYDRVKQILLEMKTKSLTEEELERIRKKKIGGFLRSLNSPEFIANQFTRYAFNDMNLFDIVETLEKLKVNEIKDVLNEIIDEKNFTVCEVVPK